jgi:hypothetical protein
MKIAVHLARHRRLAALGGLSLLLHLFALAWIDAFSSPPPPAIGQPIPLRLVRSATPAVPPARVQPLPEPVARAAAAARPAARPPAAPTPTLAPALAGAAPAAAPAAAATAATDLTPGTPPLRMPGRYRVRPPPSATLRYAVTRSAPGQPAETGAPAQLVWNSTGNSYRLRVEGVLGVLESEGGGDDAGIAPSRSVEHGAAGGEVAVRFNRETQRIESGPLSSSATLYQGSQDRASVLMQLAGIGLAEPDQMQDVIDIVVGGIGGAQIVRFQVLGTEELATGAGTLSALHLVQLAGAGERRVELWLAPQQQWLPVQLRVTEPDGTVANQVVTSIEVQAAAQ